MARGEGQVFNICQEREATGRVFPSGPGAAALVTAACLPGPPVSSNVWSQEPEIPGKKSWTPFAWVGWLLEAEQSGQQRIGPNSVQLLGEWTPREPLKEPLGEPPQNRVENLDMCHSHNLQSCVLWIRYMIPRHLTKLFWKWYISPTNTSLATAMWSFSLEHAFCFRSHTVAVTWIYFLHITLSCFLNIFPNSAETYSDMHGTTLHSTTLYSASVLVNTGIIFLIEE